jgi:hypothetical protein
MLKTFLLFLVASLGAAQNRLTPEEKAAGWKLLFDGATSAGWVEVTGLPFPSTWTIQDGCLKSVPSRDGNQDIRTVETFHDFEFDFEWKIAKNGNSGVKYLVQKTDRWKRRNETGFSARARGMEYQLLDDAATEESRVDATRGTASLYSHLAPTPRIAAEPERFHRSRIVVKGDHVEHWYDGAKVLSYELTQPEAVKAIQEQKGGAFQRDTMISLQNHDSEVWFRNLKVRR